MIPVVIDPRSGTNLSRSTSLLLVFHVNSRIENINFVCSSDSVSPLDMAEPIAQQLTALETEGVFTYDALHQETVLVVAPLMCIVCDNPRASVLLNHLGSAALKHTMSAYV